MAEFIEKKNLQRINLPARAGLWYTASNIIARGAAFIFTPIFTRALTAEEYGYYFLYTGWLTILSTLGSLQLSGNVAYRKIATLGEERFFSAGVSANAFLAAVLCVVYLPFHKVINSLTRLDVPLFFFIVCEVFLSSVRALYFSVNRYSYKYRGVSYLNLAIGVIPPLAALAFISFAGVKKEARIYAEIITSLILTLPLLFKVKSKKLFDTAGCKELLGASFALLLYHLLHSVIGQSGRLLVSRLLSEGELGKYSLSSSVGFVITLAVSGVAIGITPWIMRKLKSGEYEKIRTTQSTLMRAASICTMLFLCILPDLFRIIAPNEYTSALAVIYPISIGALFSFLSGIVTAILLYFKKEKTATVIALPAALCAVVLGYVLTKTYGIIGTAFSTMLSYLLIYILSYQKAAQISTDTNSANSADSANNTNSANNADSANSAADNNSVPNENNTDSAACAISASGKKRKGRKSRACAPYLPSPSELMRILLPLALFTPVAYLAKGALAARLLLFAVLLLPAVSCAREIKKLISEKKTEV